MADRSSSTAEPPTVYALGWAQDLNDWDVYGVYGSMESAMAEADAFVEAVHTALLKTNSRAKLFGSPHLGGLGHSEDGLCCRPDIRETTLHD